MKIFGIPVSVHPSFYVLLAVIVFAALLNPSQALALTFQACVLFLSILIHELTHLLVARRMGIKVGGILLTPIGGIAQIRELIKDAKKEFFMAVSGPLTNLALFILLALIYSLFPVEPVLWAAKINLALGVFNLFVPALPMDGGRVLRALLSRKLGYLKATKISVIISRFLALFMFFVGVAVSNPLLPLIAIFVYMGAAAELDMAYISEYISGVPVGRIARPVLLFWNESPEIISQTLAELYETAAFLIREDGVYVVTVEGNVKKVPVLDSKTDCLRAFEIMERLGVEILPVKLGDFLLGVREEDLRRVFRVQRFKRSP